MEPNEANPNPNSDREAEEYLTEVASIFTECDDIVGHLRFSTHNPEMVVMCHVVGKLMEVVADNFTMCHNLVYALNNHGAVINEITDYLNQD